MDGTWLIDWFEFDSKNYNKCVSGPNNSKRNGDFCRYPWCPLYTEELDEAPAPPPPMPSVTPSAATLSCGAGMAGAIAMVGMTDMAGMAGMTGMTTLRPRPRPRPPVGTAGLRRMMCSRVVGPPAVMTMCGSCKP